MNLSTSEGHLKALFVYFGYFFKIHTLKYKLNFHSNIHIFKIFTSITPAITVFLSHQLSRIHRFKINKFNELKYSFKIRINKLKMALKNAHFQ